MAVRRWKVSALRVLIAAMLIIAGGCGGGGGGSAPYTLNPQALNLVFVRSADIDRATGGLSVRGLNRALAMGSFLEDILAGEPAFGIHALEPATHPISSNAIPISRRSRPSSSSLCSIKTASAMETTSRRSRSI